MELSSWRRITLLWMQWFALLVFLGGFLPIKEPVKGTASPNTDVPLDVQSEWLERKVGQVVVVVIDALRADFVLPENLLKQSGQFSRSEGAWPIAGGQSTGNGGRTGSDATSGLPRRPKIRSLHDLIEDESELVNAFLARANTPTVTLPRIKALMSGTIPGFIDVVLNFGSSKFEGDNLIEQWKMANRNLTMFGDDTWLKLFPDHFLRSDGTNSFFVSDFTEVDLNVTRHLDQELRSNFDWDVSILHYLGLDHIGHMIGPDGSAVGPKLVEMDQVIQFIKRHEMMRYFCHNLNRNLLRMFEFCRSKILIEIIAKRKINVKLNERVC